MTQQAWHDCIQKLQAWYLEQIPITWTCRQVISTPPAQLQVPPAAPVASVQQAIAPPTPVETEETDPLFSSRIGLWMQQQVPLLCPISPCICLGQHGFLQKLAQAITDHIFPAQCQLSLPPLDHALLRALLIPIPMWTTYPILQKVYPRPVPHRWQAPILPLHSIEEYLKHPELKRELWTLLLRQFSLT